MKDSRTGSTEQTGSPSSAGPRRVQALVALRLLEVLRDMDLPVEILEDEDPTQTMPRRFGLSDVVERQIRSYRDDVRRRARLTDEEVRGLFRFVIRRPDGPQVFHAVGRLLADEDRSARWTRMLPRRLQYRRARSRTRRTLKRLFGRQIGGFTRALFVIEGRTLLFIESDPGGDACHLVSGFCEEVLEQTLGGAARVTHTLCQGRGDELCRWEGELVEMPATVVRTSGDADEDVREDATENSSQDEGDGNGDSDGDGDGDSDGGEDGGGAMDGPMNEPSHDAHARATPDRG